MGTATFIRTLDGWAGDAALYQLDPPMAYSRYNDEGEREEKHTAFVIVSAAYAFGSGPETYIFPALSTGEIVSWGELDGSFRGELNHDKALSNAGYYLV